MHSCGQSQGLAKLLTHLPRGEKHNGEAEGKVHRGFNLRRARAHGERACARLRYVTEMMKLRRMPVMTPLGRGPALFLRAVRPRGRATVKQLRRIESTASGLQSAAGERVTLRLVDLSHPFHFKFPADRYLPRISATIQIPVTKNINRL